MTTTPYPTTNLGTYLDLAAIAAWNRANRRARWSYYQSPNAYSRALWKAGAR